MTPQSTPQATDALVERVMELAEECDRMGNYQWVARTNPVKGKGPATIDEIFPDGKGHPILEIYEEYSSGMSFLHNRNAKLLASLRNTFPVIATSYIQLHEENKQLKVQQEKKCICTTPNWRECNCPLAVDHAMAELEKMHEENKRLREALEPMSKEYGNGSLMPSTVCQKIAKQALAPFQPKQ